MKEIKLDIADIEKLDKITNLKSKQAGHFKINDYEKLLCRYDSYIIDSACPVSLANSHSISQETLNYLSNHFENSSYNLLDYIGKIRRKVSPRICLMCGGYGNGTVDHYLPRKGYKEYSIFSYNLVPACNCNSLRNDTVASSRLSKILHPYFDDVYKGLLYLVTFEDDLNAPIFKIIPFNPAHPKIESISYHLDNLIKRTSILESVRESYEALYNRGYGILKRDLPKTGDISTEALSYAIQERLESDNMDYNTINHWYAWFANGLLLDERVLSFLATRIQSQRDGNVT